MNITQGEEIAEGELSGMTFRTGGESMEERDLPKTCKDITKLFDHMFGVSSQHEHDPTLVAIRMIREAMRLSGVHNYQPNPEQVRAFIQQNDMDEDGVVGVKDLEERVSFFINERNFPEHTSNPLNRRKSAKPVFSVYQIGDEKAKLRTQIYEQLDEQVLEQVVQECRKKFDHYDPDGNAMIEYEAIIPLLSQVYTLFNITFRPNSQDAKKYIEIMDVDQDGSIGWEEFELFVLKIVANLHQNNN